MIQEDIVLSFQGQMKILINYQVFWSILHYILHPLLLCHLLFIVSWLSFSSSSPVLLLLYSSSSSCRYAGMQWCICLWHTSSPYVTPTPPPHPPYCLLFFIAFCHHTEASVSACLSVTNKVSPPFVGASFWRGRPSSKLIVHSLAFL